MNKQDACGHTCDARFETMGISIRCFLCNSFLPSTQPTAASSPPNIHIKGQVSLILAMSIQEPLEEMPDAELLKCLDIHVVKEHKVVDGKGIRYTAYGPRDATDFTATDLKLLRQACSAACAQYDKNGLDDAAILEKLEVYVSDAGK